MRRHQTVMAVTMTAITPTPTAIPTIAPALRPVRDTAFGVGLEEADADPGAADAEVPPLPVVVGLPDEDSDPG